MNAAAKLAGKCLLPLLMATGLITLRPAFADDPQLLAPPVSEAPQAAGDTWDWRDVPRDERIPIVRATFDHAGYRLYDTNGQVIFVPFADNNLYVMKFGKTKSEMYFVNEDGSTPTLYLPEDGYLENAAESGARWYPFPKRYFYTRPVYCGPAPTWDAFITMGWYPGMVFYGGYCGYEPWRFGIVYRPMPCLTVVISGHTCRNWDEYYVFSCATPARRVVFVDRPVYRPVIVRSSGGYPAWRRDSSGSIWNRRGDGDRFDRRDHDRFDRIRVDNHRIDGNRTDYHRFDRDSGHHDGDRPRESPRPGNRPSGNGQDRPDNTVRNSGSERSGVTVFGDDRRGGYGNRNGGSERSGSSERRSSGRRGESGRDRERGRRP